MTSLEFETIKGKIENGKVLHARAEGQLEQIRKELMEKYDCNSIPEAEELLASYREEEALALEKLETLSAELMAITDWSKA